MVVLLPSLAENFYRVWRKHLPRTSTDVHGNTVYKSKYVNTSKNSFVRRAEHVFTEFGENTSHGRARMCTETRYINPNMSIHQRTLSFGEPNMYNDMLQTTGASNGEGVDFLPLPFVKFHFFKYIFVYICSVQIKALPLQSKSNENG